MTANGAAEDTYAAMRHALVETLQRRGVITDQQIAAAFATVPRHLFLPGLDPARVYSDRAIITKEQGGISLSSSSQPAIMAIQMQQLLPERGQRILEIGAGTGYNAALLRFLVGPAGRVTTVDVDDDIVAAARAGLAAAGYGDVRVILGDGGYGYPADAPYDRIILTVGASDILPAWIAQLRPNGILVLPIQVGSGMFSVALRKLPDGTLLSESLAPCGFIRLRGAFASAEQQATIAGWDIYYEPGPRLDPARLPTLLAAPATERPLPAEIFNATYLPAFAGEPVAKFFRVTGTVDPPMEGGRHALVDTTAMSACVLPPWSEAALRQGEIVARLFGSAAAYDRLRALLQRWVALGRPSLYDLRLRVIPRGLAVPPDASLTIPRTHATLVLASRDGRAIGR